jgi:hypothetical protein
MLRTNGGCRLPCWWGVKPGKTTWDEAMEFLQPYSTCIGQSEPDGHFGTYFCFSTNRSDASNKIYVSMWFQDWIIDFIRIDGVQDVPEFYLANLMDDYGIPGEVKIDAHNPWGFSVDGDQLIGLQLYYPNLGVFANFATWGERKGDITHGCFNNGPLFGLWDPMTRLSYADVIESLGLVYEQPYLPSELALGMDSQTFYQKYRSPNQAVCIETPSKIWRWWETPTP